MAIKKIHSVNLDAAESVFFARELEHIKSEVFEVEYQELKARTLIPMSTSADPADEFITYRQFDKVGSAKLISDYASDLPRVDRKGQEFQAKVRSIGDSYGYSLQEIRASRKTGRPLDQMRADTAREAALILENDIAWFGDTAHMLDGVLSNANVTSVTIPADGAGSLKTWASKTGEQMARDMHLVANSIVELTKGREIPDTLLLPLEQLNLASSTRLSTSTASDVTALEFFMKTSKYIKNVEWLEELDGAGAGATDVVLAYKRDPRKLTMEVPQDFEQLPPQERGLEFVVPCHQRTGGVIIYKPLSLAKGEGI